MIFGSAICGLQPVSWRTIVPARSLVNLHVVVSFLQRNQPSTSTAKDALVVGQAPVGRPPTISGLASRNAGLWVVGAPIGVSPSTLGAHHDDD